MLTTLILAGGMGSRLGDLTRVVPKPLVEICGKPISLHLVDYLQKFKIYNFIFAVGYKKEKFHKFFKELFNQSLDIEYNLKNPNGLSRKNIYEQANFRLIDTGLYNQTGSRIAQVFDLIDEDIILCTYGDGLANVDINLLLETHYRNKTSITITAVTSPARFGGMEIKEDKVLSFSEKKPIQGNWINGGFMIISREFRNKYLNKEEDCILEQMPLEKAAQEKDLGVYKHFDFWQCMDTPRDHKYLENLYRNNKYMENFINQ